MCEESQVGKKLISSQLKILLLSFGYIIMSGHSKWSQIKRKKGIKDQQRGQIFSKLSRLISLAVSENGIIDPENNIKLRMAIQQAKAVNMPKENIKRAIEKGAGPEKEDIKDIIYEAFGPGGTVFIINATTDNQNRTFSEIKRTLDRYGGKIGGKGSVSYLFKKCALLVLNKKTTEENNRFEIADEIGSFDIDEDKESFFIYFPFENIGRINQNKFLGINTPELDYKPNTYIKVEDLKNAKQILELVSQLENLDDVQKVYSNFDIPEEIMGQIEV